MSRYGGFRRLVWCAPWGALLLAGCGGDGMAPTAPGGGDQTLTYQLTALGKAGLPADLQAEDCMLTRFYRGRLGVTQNGNWEIRLQVHDESGDWGYLDKGSARKDGDVIWFDSEVSGLSYAGTVDGPEWRSVHIMYDWCSDGVPDVQLVFDR